MPGITDSDFDGMAISNNMCAAEHEKIRLKGFFTDFSNMRMLRVLLYPCNP